MFAACGYIVADGDVCLDAACGIYKRNDRCVAPVVGTVFMAVANLTMPDVAGFDGVP